MMLAAIALIVAGLFFARDVLIPIALAILLSFLLTPVVTRLERMGLNRIGSVLAVVTVGFLVLGMIGWIVAGQIIDLARDLPSYQDNIHNKVVQLRGSGGAFSDAKKVVDQIGKDLAEKRPESQPATQPAAALPGTTNEHPLDTPLVDQSVRNLAGKPTTDPIQVKVVDDRNTFQVYGEILGPYLTPLGTAGIVIVFVIFMMIAREDLRDRFIRLVSRGNINITTQALDEASTRISRYLLMQLVVNVTYGIPIAVGLWLIGIPNALLWGLMATVLRFIPYIGPWIAAAMPILLSLAISQSWTLPIYTILLFVVIELISNNVIEPWLYGTSTGMSAIAVLVSAVFWTWLWGVPGLLLSTPMTVCLAVMGKYVPQLQFLNILLGDEPVLEPPMRVYQRLLAMDQEEATDLVEEYLNDKTLIQLYDEVLIPALGLAEQDQHAGRLDADRRQFIRRAMREIVDDLGERHRLPVGKVDDASEEVQANSVKATADANSSVCVVCLPARDEADEIVAMMVAQVLEIGSCQAKYVPVDALASEMVEAADRHRARIVCISALPPSAVTHARYLCKRLRAQIPDISLVVGLWGAKGDIAKTRARLSCKETDQVVRSLTEVVEQIQPLVQTLTAASAIRESKEKSAEKPADAAGGEDGERPQWRGAEDPARHGAE
jgi:predicted PurR-regulated permease PerM